MDNQDDNRAGYVIALILVLIFGGLTYFLRGTEGLLKWLSN